MENLPNEPLNDHLWKLWRFISKEGAFQRTYFSKAYKLKNILCMSIRAIRKTSPSDVSRTYSNI